MLDKILSLLFCILVGIIFCSALSIIGGIGILIICLSVTISPFFLLLLIPYFGTLIGLISYVIDIM